MESKADLYIDGEWRGGSGDRRFPVLDPAATYELASFAVAEESDCIAAVEAAHAPARLVRHGTAGAAHRCCAGPSRS